MLLQVVKDENNWRGNMFLLYLFSQLYQEVLPIICVIAIHDVDNKSI